MNDIQDTELGTMFDAAGNFVSVTDAQRVMLTTWAAASRIFQSFPAFARLDLSAVSKGCGKTTAMEVIIALCPEPVTVAYSTQASVKNWLDEYPDTTFGLDERDLLFGTMGRATGSRAELIAILNAGYAQNGKVMSTRNGHSVLMPVYNAMAHAGIGRAYDTLVDRSVTITLQKAKPSDVWVSVLHERTLHHIGKDVGEWLNGKKERQALAREPKMVEDIGRERDPRDKLKLAPLAAVAKLAGCYEQWLDAEHELHTGIQANPMPSRGEMLLATLIEKMPGMRLTADEIRISCPGEFTEGRLGDIEIAGLLRSAGVETSVSNSVRGYVIPKSPECEYTVQSTQYTEVHASEDMINAGEESTS